MPGHQAAGVLGHVRGAGHTDLNPSRGQITRDAGRRSASSSSRLAMIPCGSARPSRAARDDKVVKEGSEFPIVIDVPIGAPHDRQLAAYEVAIVWAGIGPRVPPA